MTDSPLTPEEYAVYSVLFDEGPHAPTELARRTGMPPTSMSHFVRAMFERGHAERALSPADRRSYRIVLTDAGPGAHAAASAAFSEADARFVRRPGDRRGGGSRRPPRDRARGDGRTGTPCPPTPPTRPPDASHEGDAGECRPQETTSWQYLPRGDRSPWGCVRLVRTVRPVCHRGVAEPLRRRRVRRPPAGSMADVEAMLQARDTIHPDGWFGMDRAEWIAAADEVAARAENAVRRPAAGRAGPPRLDADLERARRPQRHLAVHAGRRHPPVPGPLVALPRGPGHHRRSRAVRGPRRRSRGGDRRSTDR